MVHGLDNWVHAVSQPKGKGGKPTAPWKPPAQGWAGKGAGTNAWKQNGAGTTGTAVDFIELAESPNGNYVCGLFLYHQWNDSSPAMRLVLLRVDETVCQRYISREGGGV